MFEYNIFHIALLAISLGFIFVFNALKYQGANEEFNSYLRVHYMIFIATIEVTALMGHFISKITD